MKAQEIAARIQTHYGCAQIPSQSCDGFVCGEVDAEITGVITTFTVTADVLRQAVRAGCNMIVTHEPTFFLECMGAWAQVDPVFGALRQMAQQHGIVIWRCHDMMHSASPDDIYEGFIDAMGWRAYAQTARKKSMDMERFIADFYDYYEIPQTTLAGLAGEVKQKLQMPVLRCAGDPNRPCTRIGVLVGGGSMGFGQMLELPLRLLREKKLDVLVCGEIMELLMGTYMADAAALDLPGGMLVLGHERSEEWGMRAMQEWLTKELEIPVIFVDAKEPFYYL